MSVIDGTETTKQIIRNLRASMTEPKELKAWSRPRTFKAKEVTRSMREVERRLGAQEGSVRARTRLGAFLMLRKLKGSLKGPIFSAGPWSGSAGT